MTIRKMALFLLCIALFSCRGEDSSYAKPPVVIHGDTLPLTVRNPAIFSMPIISPNTRYDNHVIEVKTFAELYKNIGSDRTLKLVGDVYKIPASQSGNASAKVNKGLVIRGVSNLKIIGAGNDFSQFIQADTGAAAIRLVQCKNILIQNISAGHGTSCKGNAGVPLISLEDCHDIFLSAVMLAGCGGGLSARHSQNLNCQSINIRECSAQTMSLVDCKNMLFTTSIFMYNCNFPGAGNFNFSHSQEIGFDKCFITKNTVENRPLFQVQDSTQDVYLRGCQINTNKASGLSKAPQELHLLNCTIQNNSWQD